MGNIRWGGQGKLRGTVNDKKNGQKCKLHGRDSKVPVYRSRNDLVWFKMRQRSVQLKFRKPGRGGRC